MTGGLIQLAAVGIQDIFLTNDPQITFFKMVYRRHTNFSVEPIKQTFIQDLDFKKKATCNVSRNGDLMGKILLVIELPQIKEFLDSNGIDNKTKFAWVKKIGYAIIKEIEIEIGGKVIDRHYGEWLNIWTELTTDSSRLDNMIGNIPELYKFSNGKDGYTLYIPLQFWFCRTSGLALPIISLQYSDIKINVELNDFDKCHIITPSHYIEIENDFAPFEPFEYIQQDISSNDSRFGMFTHFDIETKRMYYTKISSNNFETNNIPSDSKLRNNDNYPFNIINNQNDIYRIYSTKNHTWVYPKIGTVNNPTKPYTYIYQPLRNITIKDCYLIIDYYYIDEDERNRFANSRHDYLIEQLQFSGEKTFDSPNNYINIDYLQPSKLLIWVAQQAYLNNNENNDFFNYTNDYKYDDNNQLVGSNLINSETLYLNSYERLSMRNWAYFNYVQPYQNFSYDPDEGINIYSFSIFPEKNYPSGTCNMSQIDNSFIKFSTESIINSQNKGKFRAYSLGYNIYRIASGLGGIVFDS
ncbi:NCLDV major capsid protein [Catovirus CTV1]|mgnify:CR=1 FL=1|uniref:NCLDV major capsid protein n=1 Tax=Catovirus CTV1 TaxID=1977631 RepID=A0A1V0SCB2_9VIRU|nr:NCLDV major capsid protein [Catovirus CTV1]